MELPKQCPSCSCELNVQTLVCPTCKTKIEGDYQLPLLAILENDYQNFIVSFVKNSGSLKKMAKEMNLSYPTVRNHLDEIIDKITSLESAETKNENKKS